MRLAARSTAVAAVALMTTTVAAIPAFAVDDGEVPASKLSVQATLGIFVGIPVGIFAIIAFLVLLPSIVRGPRYRPGRPWTADPVWFGAPSEAPKALPTSADTSALTAAEDSARREFVGGGASASW
jgi:hypothetical protein